MDRYKVDFADGTFDNVKSSVFGGAQVSYVYVCNRDMQS